MKKILITVKKWFVNFGGLIKKVSIKIDYGFEKLGGYVFMGLKKGFGGIKRFFHYIYKFEITKVIVKYVMWVPRWIKTHITDRLYKGFKQKWHDTSLANKRAITGYLFISPWIIGFLGLVVYPFGRVVFMSLNNVNLYQQSYTFEWVGLSNFERILFEDIDFVIELQNFIVRVLLYSPVIIALSIIIAMLLNQNIKGKGIFRMIFFLPIIILNGELLENMSNYGGMDINLSFFIIDILNTLIPHSALSLFIDMFEVLIELLWYCGVPILIFLAMLQKVDKSLYEAASIDGANSWSIFWKIVLPAIYPAVSVSIIFIVVFLANFDGNPINLLILQSKNDGSRRDGYASAMALIYASIQIVVITFLFMLTRDRSSKKGRV